MVTNTNQSINLKSFLKKIFRWFPMFGSKRSMDSDEKENDMLALYEMASELWKDDRGLGVSPMSKHIDVLKTELEDLRHGLDKKVEEIEKELYDDFTVDVDDIDDIEDETDVELEAMKTLERFQKEKQNFGLKSDTEVKKADEPKIEPTTDVGLPIVFVSGTEINGPGGIFAYRLSHNVEDVFEHVKIPISTNDEKKNRRIPFRHLDTECDLIITQNTTIIAEGTEANNVIIRRPNIYYRSDWDSERFPCECLCIVDDRTYKLFEVFENLGERAKQIEVFSRLSHLQKEFIFSMANRPVQKDEAQEEKDDVFTPIRDVESLKMMYEVCKNTYKPSVRARVEALKSQIDYSNPNDREALINQLAFSVAIDTESHERPKRTYEECMAIMDKHIYGLEEVKESIVEFIISMQETGSSYFVLLLVGPPGVGKTSIANGISECMWDMPILQIDCSGADALKFKGLFKSYSGAKPGEIVDGFRDKGKTDIIVLFDELDKMDVGNSGDPRGALIKPLGPQRKFYDEYVADDIDVSATKFIATANDIDKIPGYILSRFENCIFEINPYTEEEKMEIAQNHLIPKILAEYKLKSDDCSFDEGALKLIIREHCYDEGVRDLSGNIRILVRKLVTERCRKFIKFPFCVGEEYVESHLKKKIQKNKKRTMGFQ